MRLHIRHETRYSYEQAPRLVVQALRLWPAASSMQNVRKWNVRVDGKRLWPTSTDGFGNSVATHTLDRKVAGIDILVRGIVTTQDTAGVHAGDTEVLPPAFYILPTALTQGTPELYAFARDAAGSGSVLERLHRLCQAIRDHVDYVPRSTKVTTTATEAFVRRAGVCQDHAHIMIAAARGLDLPARYVSGYLCPLHADQGAASHAWTEVRVPNLGWVGFDAANRQSPDARYVRIASGRDYRDAAPIRGLHVGGSAEKLAVKVSIREAEQAQQ